MSPLVDICLRRPGWSLSANPESWPTIIRPAGWCARQRFLLSRLVICHSHPCRPTHTGLRAPFKVCSPLGCAGQGGSQVSFLGAELPQGGQGWSQEVGGGSHPSQWLFPLKRPIWGALPWGTGWTLTHRGSRVILLWTDWAPGCTDAHKEYADHRLLSK